jgi:signal transduction histidine kinase
MISIGGVQNGDVVEVCIQDSGIGMTEGEVQKLFHPDKRFTNPGTNQEKGTGIGLLITKEMIGNNGGTIRVSSERNKGTKFTFTLPVAIS